MMDAKAYLDGLRAKADAKASDPARQMPEEYRPATTAQHVQQERKSKADRIGEFVNQIIKRVAAAKPAWRQGFKSEAEMKAYRATLTDALRRNRISSIEMVERAIARAIDDASPFFPSVGQLIAWAKEGEAPSGELNAGMYRLWKPSQLLPKETEQARRERGREELKKLRAMLAGGGAQ